MANTVGRPRKQSPRRKGATAREEILDAASELFTRNGFATTSTHDIANAVGIRQASLYYHFPSKRDIFITLLMGTIQPALDLASGGEFDLLILDVGLPRMDGFQVLKALRDMDVQIPILMVTARTGVDDTVQGLEGGANDYIAKPIDVDKLVSLCRVWCSRCCGPTSRCTSSSRSCAGRPGWSRPSPSSVWVTSPCTAAAPTGRGARRSARSSSPPA